MAWFVLVGRPEAGAVRRQHLIADDQFVVLVQTEFKLGIRYDDTAGKGVIRTLLIEGEGAVSKLCGIFLALSREIFL